MLFWKRNFFPGRASCPQTLLVEPPNNQLLPTAHEFNINFYLLSQDCLSKLIEWFEDHQIILASGGAGVMLLLVGNTVEPLLSGPPLSGQPLLNGHISKSRNFCNTNTINYPSIKQPPLLSGRGHPKSGPK